MNKTPINDGGPAFPVSHPSIEATTPESAKQLVGMTLRDWFAGMALQGLLASGDFTVNDGDQSWMATHEDPYDHETGEETHKGRRKFDFTEAAWRCADEMISNRERKEDA